MLSDEEPEHLQNEILELVFITGKAMRLMLREWAFEGAARCIGAWSNSHRTFSAMDLEERRRKYLFACLRDHEFHFRAL